MVENIDLADFPFLAVGARPGAAARIVIFLDADIAALDLGGVFRASEPHVLQIYKMATPFHMCRT